MQSAYEVLSDPQERAWYDSHRDVILREHDPQDTDKADYSYNTRMTTAEEVTHLMLKFNGRLEMSDSPSGFFGGLREFFEKLAKEEEIACNWENLESVDYPSFGHKNDDYDSVVRPFYAAWNGFATRKSFSWKDLYRLADAPDRRVRRLMEKENKRLREDAIRKYNDAVRSLIAFVKKRDTRYQENVKSEAERQKTLRDAAAAQAARSKAARQAQMEKKDKHVVPEWAQSQLDEAVLSSEEEASEEEQQFECIVCDKTFKSEKQFEAHEKSKKHIKLLRQLKKDMKEDDTAMHSAHDKHETTTRSVREHIDSDTQEDKAEATAEIVPSESKQVDMPRNTGVDESYRSTDDEDGSLPELQSRPFEPSLSTSSGETDSDYAPRDAPAPTELPLRNLTSIESPATDESPAKPGKAKQKRAKKAAQQATAAGTSVYSFKCATCQSSFPSKTRLFSHLKDRGHSQPVAKPSGKGTKI